MSLPFLTKKPIDLPPIVSIELIQITDKTNIPFAPKAKKIIEEVKKKEEKLVSEQAPPKKVKKIKPDAVPMPDDKIKKVEKIKEDKQNPEKIDNEVKQVSEFEKKELFDPNNIAALIDKSKEESAETIKKSNKVTQDQQKNVESFSPFFSFSSRPRISILRRPFRPVQSKEGILALKLGMRRQNIGLAEMGNRHVK